MDAYFGQIMTVSSTQIDQLLQPFVNTQNHISCTDPNPTVYNQDSHQTTFRWSGAAGSTYQLAYLNLLTGDHGTATTDEIQHSFGVEDGLYMFIFQRTCGIRSSNTIIIILDKVVALEVASNMGCNCHYEVEFSGNQVESLALSEYNEVSVSIRNEENIADVPFKMHMKRACITCTTYDINPYCANNAYVDFTHNVGYLDIDESVDNVITFNGPELMLESDLPAGYELAVAVCSKKRNFPYNQFLGLRITPLEPGSSYQLDAPPNTHLIHNARLVNQAGQVLAQFPFEQEDWSIQQLIDLSNYPAGMYFLQLEGIEGPEVRKLLRY